MTYFDLILIHYFMILQTKINTKCIRFIFSARNTKLGYLNMSWNKVCGKGGVAIFRALMVSYKLFYSIYTIIIIGCEDRFEALLIILKTTCLN
jgi:hypothetical protein